MYEILKRITDILAAIFVIILFSPLLLVIAIAIPLDSTGPIIYKQRRVGKDGKIFFIWKFRSMYDQAENLLLKDKEFMKNLKKKEGWKLEADQDPRITRVGRFTRKYSLDELPNLWNILNGDMSIVGPRAYRNDDIFGDEMAQQLKFYPGLEKELKIALSVKPGLTGPWQTGGRNKITWDKRVKLDAEYAKNKSILSIWRDFLIVLKTPFAMFNKW